MADQTAADTPPADTPPVETPPAPPPARSASKKATVVTAAATTADFTVAKNRTLTHGDPDDPEPQNYKAGDTVTLSIKEGRRLQRLGFLVKDDGTVALPIGGPPTEAGEEIVEQGAGTDGPRVSVTQL